MGWWQAETKGRELLIGDEPVDAAGTMLDKILAAYTEEVKRKPTPEELARTIQIALNGRFEEVFDDVGDKQLSAVAIRFAKRPKRQRINVGDYFAVPLSTGGYGYGHIKDIFLTSILLIDFLNLHSEFLLSLADVREAPVLFESLCGYLLLANWEWPVIGNVPVLDRDLSKSERERLAECDRRIKVTRGPVTARELLERLLSTKHA